MAPRTVVYDALSSPVSEDARLLSSPPRMVDARAKERRNPSITPRKFRRFFTPRSRVSSQISPARQALHELAAPQVNNRYQTPALSSPLNAVLEDDALQENSDSIRTSKRRKVRHDTPQSSPCRPLNLPTTNANLKPRTEDKPALLSPIRSLQSSQATLESEDDDSGEETECECEPVRRLAPLTARGLSGQLVQRELGGMPRPGRAYMSCPVSDWRSSTANFYSRHENTHSCSSHEHRGLCIPFCSAACNTNSLVAVGDEEGRVRVLDSSGDPESPFSKIHVSFQAHTNAVIDLDFSRDDMFLATASGDQTGRVIDMMTQSPIAVLHNHTASLKQIRFQPGKANHSVIATSSRDGSVQIWDLRCTGGAVQDIGPLPDRTTTLGFQRTSLKQGCPVNSIYDAHARTLRQARQPSTVGAGDTPSRGELPGRVGDVSVTALQFLPPGREHLLLTACESDASIKLWDIRAIHTSRHKAAAPLSVTAPPTSHSTWRPFGISSLALSTDAARLYALCKDNTVYAYSTPHLILGNGHDLSTRQSEPPRRRYGAVAQHGLGPMYGFRHPRFHATTFYVKCEVRPARDGRSELLAVGSNDNCAVLFPTQERNFRSDLAGAMNNLSLESSTIGTKMIPNPGFRFRTPGGDSAEGVRRPLFRSNSLSNMAARGPDDIPIIRTGTPLVRGHAREVGSLTWTNEGKLITVGDDCMIRSWVEDREEARDLRVGGEAGGRRWACGWAEVGDDYDQEDDDDADEY